METNIRETVVPVRRGYDRWAEIYDSDGNPLVALEEPIVRKLLGKVRNLKIADVGCGTGRHAVWLARQGARVTALDFSEGMLRRARARRDAERVRFIRHDITRPLPLPSKSFDQVLSCLVLEHIRYLNPFFKELARICRPDGFILISAMHPAMGLRGLSARFIDPKTGHRLLPRSHPQRVSDHLSAVINAKLHLDHISEHAPGAALAKRYPRAEKYVGWPMLLVMQLRPQRRM